MESIIASDIKSFLFSNGLISDHQFGFRPSHSTLDMLLLLSQQWMEVLNAGHEIRAIFLDISCAFDTSWHPALLTKLSSNGVLHCAKSFLGTPELLTTYKAFIRSLMEYCSPLQAGAGGPLFLLSLKSR